MVHEKTSDAQGAFFEVRAKHKGQKPIQFGRIESEPVTCENSEDDLESPQFSHYWRNSHRMIENMGYDLTKRSSLKFNKGRRTLLRSFVPKGKAPDYYQKTRRGLGYVSTPISLDFEFEESLYHDHSSRTSSWESNVNICTIFQNLSVNMVSSSHLEDENEEMIKSDIDPWIKHLNTLWDIRFEKREPPTENKVVHINLGSEANPKPIFVKESLLPSEKKDLIHLI